MSEQTIAPPILLGYLIMTDVHLHKTIKVPYYMNLVAKAIAGDTGPVLVPTTLPYEQLLDAITTWESKRPNQRANQCEITGICIIPNMLIFLEAEILEDSQLYWVREIEWSDQIHPDDLKNTLQVQEQITTFMEPLVPI